MRRTTWKTTGDLGAYYLIPEKPLVAKRGPFLTLDAAEKALDVANRDEQVMSAAYKLLNALKAMHAAASYLNYFDGKKGKKIMQDSWAAITEAERDWTK